MLDHIISETNNYIARLDKGIRTTTKDELLGFFGILLAVEKNRSQEQHINELWSENKLFKNHYSAAALSRNRFKEFFSKVRFDNREPRQERIDATGCWDEAIKFVFDKFISEYIKNYSPGDDLTVDERLAVYQGRCPFKIFMKSKPDKFGIKIWIGADARLPNWLHL